MQIPPGRPQVGPVVSKQDSLSSLPHVSLPRYTDRCHWQAYLCHFSPDLLAYSKDHLLFGSHLSGNRSPTSYSASTVAATPEPSVYVWLLLRHGSRAVLTALQSPQAEVPVALWVMVPQIRPYPNDNMNIKLYVAKSHCR